MLRTWDRRESMPILVRKPTGKRPLARPWRRQQDFIITDFEQMGWEGVD
jgi:hypothetical protein